MENQIWQLWIISSNQLKTRKVKYTQAEVYGMCILQQNLIV